jgi:cellobiose phosphorylase
VSLITLHNIWKRVPLQGSQNGALARAAVAKEESPFRSELFSVEQLQVHAQVLAGWHKISETPGRDRLLSRLGENEKVLLDAHEQVSAAVLKGYPISPAGEWLVDNFYLIEEQIRTARRHLPKTYSRQLPQLSNGPAAGLPRVYHLALELIAHLDGGVGVESVTHFIASYQVSRTLRLGELWAVPIMLRLALLENLRRIAARIASGRKDRELADAWADRLVKTAESEPAHLILVLADMARSNPPLSPAFVAEFSRQLQGKSPALVFAASWVEQRLSEQAQSVEQLVHLEAQQQAANQVSMGNSIASLRVLAAIDWRDFVEELSAVEHVLRRDPAAVYSAMDFATRDRYRHAVENIAKHSLCSEEEAARLTVALASTSAQEHGMSSREAHVGYYLVDKGLPRLEAAAKAHVPLRQRMDRRIYRAPLFYYLGLVALITAVLSFGLTRYAHTFGLHSWGLWALAALLVMCISQLAIALVNWAVTVSVPPRMMPRMNFTKGIPPQWATMVVVPTMLTSPQGVEALLEGLEVRYLANRDRQLYFALLTDFKDAAEETLPEDGSLFQAAREGIDELNDKHALGGHQPFFLFHRPRRWNAGEKRWMGYERKRGKLAEFNAVLRGGPADRFAAIVGDASVLPSIKYVITLDTDTELPRDSARQLVATMAHPLVKPRWDAKKGRIEDGYAILQPRVAINLPSANRSWFAKLFCGDPGIDPYTRVVSDVYQDLFQEGSFIGKGIYDVDAFEKSLANRFPENRILSHDLLEGCYARAGLVSDIQLYEDHPWHYNVEMRRRHRWIRGDWQIAAWLLPRIPGAAGQSGWNPLSLLSRWKILDNLRRSLASTALLILLLLGWTALPSPRFWTAVVACIMATPAVLAAVVDLCRKPKDFTWSLHSGAVGRGLLRNLLQIIVALVFLPYDAVVSIDAIGRTLFRQWLSRRRLLEWETASDAARRARTGVRAFVLTMLAAPLLAIAMAALLRYARPSTAAVAAPFLAFWILSPGLAWLLSRPLMRPAAHLTRKQEQLLRIVARRTWHYFETFVGAEDHYLPPDNFQQHPVALTAHRTSPTNIGMGLLATMAACDFGYLSGGQMIDRTSKTLMTMNQLERYRGHFYNWYDTRTLQPMPPLYISTVDSGNLAGFLLTLRQGLLEHADHPIVGPRTFDGLGDVVLLLMDQLRNRRGSETAMAPAPAQNAVTEKLQNVLDQLQNPPGTPRACDLLLEQLQPRLADVAQQLAGSADEDLRWASDALLQQCRYLHADLQFLAPWLALPLPPPAVWIQGTPEQIKRLADLRESLRGLEQIPTLRGVAQLSRTLLPELGAIVDELQAPGNGAVTGVAAALAGLRSAIAQATDRAAQRCATLETLAEQCDGFAQMEYQFLFDKSREQLTIGFNVADRRCDASFYDLLASEARLGIFVAIAQGQLPQDTWFALGRSLTSAARQSALLSWSGSMFEYLMPLLVMPTYDDTLLDQTYRAVVRRQIQYGRERSVPWGISESGYNMTDARLNYQYRAFGIPGLGFKRGLGEDVVIAPYATVLALMVDPEDACRNLEQLAADGFLGRFGFYEAVDYTPARVPKGQPYAIVRSFMAHHQGMSLLSLTYQMLGRPMQRRFLNDPFFKATELLLHERIPKAMPVYPHAAEVEASESRNVGAASPVRVMTTPNTHTPEVHLLSNGRYHVMISNAGGGYSRWKDLAVTRWHEDPTRDCWGSYCYVRDVQSKAFWSNTYQPTLKSGISYEATFQQARAEFRRSDADIDTHTEICVSPEDDVELRRVTVTNRSRARRAIDLTSYAEVVIAPASADAAHPAFSNLFVQTQIIRNRQAILCTRRPRSTTEKPPWMIHLMAVPAALSGDVSYETDRAKFIGRGRGVNAPAAMEEAQLSDSQGAVLDPIVSIRQTLQLEPDASITIVIATGIAETQEGATALIEKYHDPRLADRAFEMAWTHSQVMLRQLNVTEADAQLFARLAGAIVHPTRQRRADPGILIKNRRGQSALWSYSISGDLPIVLVRIGDQSKAELVRQLTQAHAYWRVKGLVVDLVIWNEDHSGYRQALQDQIMGLISAGPEAHSLDRPGGVFVRRSDQMSDEDRILMQTVARVVMTDTGGTFADQVEKYVRPSPAMPRLIPNRRRVTDNPPPAMASRNLTFFNGVGGFTADGKEYVIDTNPKSVTPAPWCNVLANPRLGTVISESGSAYTWFQNAHEYRLTPWSDDPISDGCGEALYIRDDVSGEFWSPTPLPARGRTAYTSRHGMGYSVFEHAENGIRSELSVFVSTDAPVKFAVLKITNISGRARQLSAFGYWEWVLAEMRSKSLMHVVTELDSQTGAILARNPYNTDFADCIAFVDVNEPARSITGDRTEFLGRNGTLGNPAAMTRTKLSGKVGAGLDPCAAIQVPLEIADGQQRELVFILGAATSVDEARRLVGQFRSSQGARQAQEGVWNYWKRTLGTVYVETPDASVNLLANGWLLYQTLACRMWARSGFYQSGGAFGFRDQLQDAMALVHAEPRLLREHLLRCAGHQFREGDVQHWWHPPQGRGVRTHFSDDYLWLPLATCRYVATTGDTGVLDEVAPFLEGRAVKPEEEAYYDLPGRSDTAATLYDHCTKAIENGLKFGIHGLPLMGCGDWNDGMNLVGEHGRGESVWLAFFLYDVLTQFAALAQRRGDAAFAQRCVNQAAQLRGNIEREGWDGQWYRRAYFDDGQPLGSISNPECKIDSIPQSWSVISGAGDRRRNIQAMAAVDERLVRRDSGIIQLFDPPFDKSPLNPGYIKGYVPGVRENGGQYTHAAVWMTMAFALMGDHARAWELFNMINPVRHGGTAKDIAVYKVEPYVVAADVYAVPPHTGRGGWTWYTGSAGWMYRLLVETLLGLTREPERLRFNPRVPETWNSFKLHYRFRETYYHIEINKAADGASRVISDGVDQPDLSIPLVDDHTDHHVQVLWAESKTDNGRTE